MHNWVMFISYITNVSCSFPNIHNIAKVIHNIIFEFFFRTKWVSEVSEIAQLCPTLCDPVDHSLSGSSIHGILQARILEWVAISFSRGSSWPRDRAQVFHIGGRCFNLWATREALKKNSHQMEDVNLMKQSSFQREGHTVHWSWDTPDTRWTLCWRNGDPVDTLILISKPFPWL